MNFYKYKLEYYPKDALDDFETVCGITAAKSMADAVATTIKAFCSENNVESIKVSALGLVDDCGVLLMANEEAITQLEDSLVY